MSVRRALFEPAGDAALRNRAMEERADSAVAPQARLEQLQSLRRTVHVPHQPQIFFGDGSAAQQPTEVDGGPPPSGAVEQDGRAVADLAGLKQGHELPQFVHGSEASRKDDQGPSGLGEPELAQDKLEDVETEFGCVVGERLMLRNN